MYIYFVINYLINLNIKVIAITLKNIKLYNKNNNLLFLTELFLFLSKSIFLEIFKLKKKQKNIINMFYKKCLLYMFYIFFKKYILKKNLKLTWEIKYLILYR